ncbi:MAG: magnesium transporter [Vampirovibrionales bacterium]|nr:magnesium transporter [Vampirovibrionales bacterium]
MSPKSFNASAYIDSPTLGAPLPLHEKVKRALDHKNPSVLRRLLNRSHFADVAEAMTSHLTRDEAVTCFQYLNMGQAAQILLALEDELQAHCLNTLPSVMGSKMLHTMANDDAVDILQELDADASQRLLEGMPVDADTQAIQRLLLEEPDTAAGLMTTDYVAVDIGCTIGEAIEHIRNTEEKDFIYYVYVVDERHQLLGVLSVKQLLLSDPATPIHEVMNANVVSALIHFDDAFVANLFRKYDNLLAMPVTDTDNTLRGIITVDDIIEVMEEDSSEEIYRASGIDLDEVDERNLLTGPYLNAVKARLPWLSITVMGQLLGSFIIASFAPTIQTAVIAVSFMPLLTGLAGNMGTQTDTISVRGLALGLIHPKNIGAKLRRELQVALTMGGTFALLVGFFSFFVYHDIKLTLLLSGWILTSLIATSLIGMAIPYAYSHFLKKDPAGVGGPFITTLSDIMTFSLYLYLLSLLYHHPVGKALMGH